MVKMLGIHLKNQFDIEMTLILDLMVKVRTYLDEKFNTLAIFVCKI